KHHTPEYKLYSHNPPYSPAESRVIHISVGLHSRLRRWHPAGAFTAVMYSRIFHFPLSIINQCKPHGSAALPRPHIPLSIINYQLSVPPSTTIFLPFTPILASRSFLRGWIKAFLSNSIIAV